MVNSKKDIDKVAAHVTHAAVVGNNASIMEAARRIENDFILIRKSDLPTVEMREKYSPVKGEMIERPIARTASYMNGPSSYYFNRALDVLAIALYAETKEKEKAEKDLTKKRQEAYRLLHPTDLTLWSYEALPPKEKAQVDTVVDLMLQVDELQNKK